VLIVDHIQTALELVGKLTTIRIPHKAYNFIPLEVGLGTKEIDEDIRVKPINKKEIIKFLKSDIINPYRSYYKKKHGEKIKETFVLFTPDFFDDLEPLDRKYCERISYKTKTFFVADVNKVQQRGRVFKFLEKIGYAGSKWYGRIDEVYVPPLDYEDMKRTLKEKRIVFITGTQEYGKTYTAVRLMWEYYNSGYEPKWIKGGERAERVEVRRKLEDIRAELKPGHIIYFEDPFGKTKYERREGLEREIGTIIDTVRQIEDVFVIVTSREEVFKEFEKEKISAKELGVFERKLNVKKSSYDYEKRKEILLTWAEAENCKWLETERLKELVLRSIKYEKILPTPLSIKDFAVASFGIEKESELREKIKEKSKETAKAFAEEIKNMTDDKILFLSFLFISDNFKVEFVRATYQELVEELDLKDAWEFDRVLDWFKDDKININPNAPFYLRTPRETSQFKDDKYSTNDEGINFSHSSYSEALPYLLVEDGYITRINRDIFSELLFKLAEKDKGAGAVASAVANNFDKLPEDVRNLLFKLSEKDVAAWDIAWAVIYNFDKLPEDVRNLLFKLAEKDKAAWVVAYAVAANFDKLPEDVRNLLFKLAEKDEAAWAVASEVAYNFDKLPEDVKNLLFKLSEKDKAAGAVAYTVAANFDKLPENVRNLLFKLKAAWAVSHAVAVNFDKLPENVRNLLFKLSEKDKAAWAVAHAVAANFDKLPENVRNLLFKLAEKDKAAWAVSHAVAANFDKLPEDVRNLLDTLQKPLQQVIEVYSKAEERRYKEQALHMISNALSKLNLIFVSKILKELSECEDETVRIKALKMLKDIFDVPEGKKEY
jgi:Mg/Co/Ni transporter MgtE